MNQSKPVQVVDSKCIIGENPLWHCDENALYWVDIPQGRLMRYDPLSHTNAEVFAYDRPIGGFTIQEDGTLLLFAAHGAVLHLINGRIQTLIEGLPGEQDSRFNDVIADPEGRVFCGTMSSDTHAGRLYLLDIDGSIKILQEEIGTSNGMGFTPGLDGFYHTDTKARNIYKYDYDRRSGRISRRRVFVHVSGEGRPDGMAVDCEGYVWSAMWDGASVVRYTPAGKENMRITFPARKVSSVSFGGSDFTDMYVTTAGGDMRSTEGRGAGSLFRIRTGSSGKAEYRSRAPVR